MTYEHQPSLVYKLYRVKLALILIMLVLILYHLGSPSYLIKHRNKILKEYFRDGLEFPSLDEQIPSHLLHLIISWLFHKFLSDEHLSLHFVLESMLPLMGILLLSIIQNMNDLRYFLSVMEHHLYDELIRLDHRILS